MTGTPIDAMFKALADGDIAAARATCTPEARIWHSYDRIALTLDEITAQWQSLVDASAERFITDIRCRPIEGGYVQQHLFVIVSREGARKAWPVCVVVQIEDGRIARLDEYIDRGGSYDPGEGALTTPGF